jgi:hypothetical protein
MTNKSRQLPRREEEQKIEELEQKIENLQNVIENLSKERESQTNTKIRDRHIDDRFDIRSDARIGVMSLCPHKLILTPKKGANPYVFDNFGDFKKIRYEDVSQIIERHRSFLEDGVFVILDKEVIKFHALEDTYDKILTKENFDRILSGNFSDAVKLVENANERQKRYIADMFVRRLIDGDDVDLNYIDQISRIVNVNIKQRADDSQQTLETYKKTANNNKI